MDFKFFLSKKEWLSFFDKSFFIFFDFSNLFWIFLANSKFFLKFLFFLLLFFKEFLFHMWMSFHIIFWKSVNFKVRIILHHVRESIILWFWLRNNFFNSSWKGFSQVFLDLSLDFRLIIDSVNFRFKFIVKSQMH